VLFVEQSSAKERSRPPPKNGNESKDLRQRARISEHEAQFYIFEQFYNVIILKLRSATEQMPALVIRDKTDGKMLVLFSSAIRPGPRFFLK
jgi:hypothetical protein